MSQALEELLDEEQAAKAIGTSRSFLSKARVTGTGPAFVKVGRSVRYEPSELRRWIERNRRKSTSHSGAAA